MLVDDLVKKIDYPIEFADLKIWELDVDEVCHANLLGLYYRASRRVSREEARRLALNIAEAITELNNIKGCRNDGLADFDITPPPMLSGEVRLGLEQLPVEVRRCAYFALLMDWDINEAAQLKWSDLKHLQRFESLCDSAMDVVQSMPRHLHSKLVFWTMKNNKPQPLRQLRSEIELAFGMSFDRLRQRFKSVIFVDTHLDAQAFMQERRG